MKSDKTLQDDCEINLCSPSNTDVLCGRGAPINKHPGNIVFRKIVKCNKELYNVCEKGDRYYLAKSVVMALEEQDPPTRFLEHHDDGNGNLTWTTISKERAIRKTVQALREKTTSRDTHQKSSSTTFKSMQKKNSEYVEKNAAWQHLLENMMPGSPNRFPTPALNSEYTNDSSKSLGDNERKSKKNSAIGRKRPRAEKHSPIPNLVDEVSSSSHQELIQTNLSNQIECTADKISSDQNQHLVSQSICNEINDEIYNSIPLSAADFHVNIDPVETCSNVKKVLELPPHIGYGLLNKPSHISSDIEIKQMEWVDKELSPDGILVDDLLMSGEAAKLEKWFDNDDDDDNNNDGDKLNTSVEINEIRRKVLMNSLGSLYTHETHSTFNRRLISQ